MTDIDVPADVPPVNDLVTSPEAIVATVNDLVALAKKTRTEVQAGDHAVDDAWAHWLAFAQRGQASKKNWTAGKMDHENSSADMLADLHNAACRTVPEPDPTEAPDVMRLRCGSFARATLMRSPSSENAKLGVNAGLNLTLYSF